MEGWTIQQISKNEFSESSTGDQKGKAACEASGGAAELLARVAGGRRVFQAEGTAGAKALGQQCVWGV